MKCNRCINFKEKKIKHDINYYKKESRGNFALFIICFILFANTLFVYCYHVYNDIHHIKQTIPFMNNEINVSDINNVINTIENKCGGTFLTKKYGENRWSVFKQFEKDGYIKYDYVALENCL